MEYSDVVCRAQARRRDAKWEKRSPDSGHAFEFIDERIEEECSLGPAPIQWGRIIFSGTRGSDDFVLEYLLDDIREPVVRTAELG